MSLCNVFMEWPSYFFAVNSNIQNVYGCLFDVLEVRCKKIENEYNTE